MDIYTPDGDNCINRPLIILAHGGSFIGGSKTNPTMVDLCETFAKRGYVAASINYRLATSSTVLGPFSGLFWMTNLENGIKVIYSAMTDAKAAVRFLGKMSRKIIIVMELIRIRFGWGQLQGMPSPHMSYINSVDELFRALTLVDKNMRLV